MQFQYNSDYPGLTEATVTGGGPTIPPQAISREPLQFPPAQPIPCARITTRVFHPSRNQVATVQNVLVRTMNNPPPGTAAMMMMIGGGGGNGPTAGSGGGIGGDGDGLGNPVINVDNNSMSSGMSSASSSDDDDDDSMNIDDNNGGGYRGQPQQQEGGLPSSSSSRRHGPLSGRTGGGTTTNRNNNNGVDNDDDVVDPNETKCAYWIQRTIREAIYGRVLFAVVLKRRPRSLVAIDGAEWEVTTDHCAVKEMSWQHIRRERARLAEDPIKEVSSMQYLKKWYQEQRRRNTMLLQQQQQIFQQQQQQLLQQQQLPPIPPITTIEGDGDVVAESFVAMKETNIMMPLDLLSDDRNLYSIMPYCDGGELFERLDLNERFSEDEARYWMDQVLNGLENMQHVGICHRDMSLENLLVHKDGALIIDMGMCLLIPYDDVLPSSTTLAASFDNLTMNRGGMVTNPAALLQQKQLLSANGLLMQQQQQQPIQPTLVSGRQRPRYLIRPQGTCGKWIYMSPEIYESKEPFDGFAVDMWAAGVILFLMLTGFPPWERACQTDERFHYMTAGYLVQMLSEWEIGLSSDAMDLLQRMLFLDPKDRLSLDQVRAHPWMVNGRRSHPLGLSR